MIIEKVIKIEKEGSITYMVNDRYAVPADIYNSDYLDVLRFLGEEIPEQPIEEIEEDI